MGHCCIFLNSATAAFVCSPVHLSHVGQAVSSKTLKHLPCIYTLSVAPDFASVTVLIDKFTHKQERIGITKGKVVAKRLISS